MHAPDSDIIILPDAPAIPGLIFRHFRGSSDFSAMVDVTHSSNAADMIDRTETVDGLTIYYEHLTNCDPFRDMIFAEIDRQVVAYGRVRWVQEACGTYIYSLFGRVVQEWRRHGIGRAMLRHNERRLREIAGAHPDDGNPSVFESEASETATGTIILLEQEGYRVVRTFYDMLHDTLDTVDDVSLPDGLEVRPVLPEHERLIWEADDEAFRDHWGYSPQTEEEYHLWRGDVSFDPSLWRVAWAGDQVAGQVQTRINVQENMQFQRKRGYIEAVSVRRPWRKLGLARVLLLLSLRALHERGMTEAALDVDAEGGTGALRLYERCGFRVVRKIMIYQKPLEPIITLP